MASLAGHLLQSAASRRSGIVLPPFCLSPTPADIPGLVNIAIPALPDAESGPASGGMGRDVESATTAAIGEALERYAGSLAVLPSVSRADLPEGDEVFDWDAFSLFDEFQRSATDFPHAEAMDVAAFTDVYDLLTNRRCWVPLPLVTLDRRRRSIATSSGLAAHPDKYCALLRALQEVIERDAFMSTWLHEVRGRRVELDSRYVRPVEQRGGQVIALDATPQYSTHPVAVVTGMVPRRGCERFSLGAACRASWEDAVEKAYLEWAQGLTFIGDRLLRNPQARFHSPADVRDFDDHAMYYTVGPDSWRDLPILFGTPGVAPSPAKETFQEPAVQLEGLLGELKLRGIRVLYRNLTTPDLRQIGTSAVRVLAPALVPVHPDHRFPHLGGSAPEVTFRYPWWDGSGRFPSRYPHPLG